MPRLGIAHSEPSKFILNRFSTSLFSSLTAMAWAFFFLSTLACADQTIYSASTQTNPLANTNEAARSAAMGSAFTGVADDASALFSNPAGLGFLGQGQLFLNSDFWLVGTFQETALFGMPTEGLGGFGLAAHYLDYGLMDGRDALGSVTASYSADRLGLQAGWGYEVLKDFSVGAGFSGTQNTLAGVGYTDFSSDLGILWKGPQGLRLGASYVNTGWVSPGGASEDAVNLGASYDLALDSTNRLLTALGASIEPNAVSYLQAGAEYSIQDQVFLRAGCQVPLSDQSIGGFTDLTAGVGFHLSGFSLDYAFLPYGDLGATHRVSVGYFFEGPKQKAPSGTKRTSWDFLKSGLSVQNGNKSKGVTRQNTAGMLNRPFLSSTPVQGLPPLPPDNATASSSRSPGFVKDAGPVTSGSQPRAVSPSDAKDSLVVQFDMPDNPAPSGAELEKEGKRQEAIAAYVDALKQNPKDAASWWALGNLYRELHEKTYAVQCFEQVLKLQPDNRKLADWLERYKASNP